MKVVAQRSKYSKVEVEGKLVNEIDKGLVLLVSFTQSDTYKNIDKMINKIVNLRIFDDDNGVMNRSVSDINGEILSISQFTLYGNVLKGNRPSYIDALNGQEAIKLYDYFNENLNKLVPTKTGVFGSDMQVFIQNDGPITIILEF